MSTNVTELNDEQFAVDLTDNTRDHAEWLAVMRYGLKTLLYNQPLLMELIVRESVRQRDRSGIESRVPADDARAIIEELGLRFVCP